MTEIQQAATRLTTTVSQAQNMGLHNYVESSQFLGDALLVAKAWRCRSP